MRTLIKFNSCGSKMIFVDALASLASPLQLTTLYKDLQVLHNFETLQF